MSNTRPLRTALLSNAIFSLSCAGVMIAAPVWVGHLLGIQIPLALQIVGLGLVVFAADLIHQATRPNLVTWRALYASIADFVWVIGTIVGVAGFSEVLSGSGRLTIVAVGAVVLIFGLWQLWGINRVMVRDCSL
ncbi:hypothetical protein XM38_041890 [Halomicronema hongdechloris C2206]|uniref:Uncharacterized protein n=1 Tax=Halomicronema hongdechloris C2206 TaxID=1641165 RepID=A0A1Z3HSW5_9CYAN|nr:hypothetical protein [Halomicronema hongdechloris]ASC73227.1 hypothetical protein XM38_041890 [Halomicronema hongdechloris C2206]